MIEHISELYELSENTGVTFLYCSYKESREAITYVRLAIKQLCRRMANIPMELQTMYDTHFRNASEPNLDELRHVFIAISNHFECVFLILDALDECNANQREDLLGFLTAVGTSKEGASTPLSRVKFFVTSRREEDIRRAFTRGAFPILEIKANRVNKDIEQYVTAQLQVQLRNGRLKVKDGTLIQRIQKALIGRADGMCVKLLLTCFSESILCFRICA